MSLLLNVHVYSTKCQHARFKKISSSNYPWHIFPLYKSKWSWITHGTYAYMFDIRSAQILPTCFNYLFHRICHLSHVHVFPLLVITPNVLDYYVTSEDVYLISYTLYIYLLGICIRPEVESSHVPPWFHIYEHLVFHISQ